LATVAVAIVCKTPTPGQSKTRLSPPLHPEECAAISSCFIQDLSRTIGRVAETGGSTGYAVYTPVGSEKALLDLLPDRFRLTPQCNGDFGERLLRGAEDLLNAGHDGAILINSDSPTLPASILHDAVNAVREGDNVVLSPALDGGYTLIGLSKLHRRLFEDIPWSTSRVYELTLNRARAIGIPVVNVPGWYDVDDAISLQMLKDELSGRALTFSSMTGSDAPATRRFLQSCQSAIAVPVI
jgi:rSAM/selenodomain-associated transferase 1